VALEQGEITRLLREWSSGNEESLHRLLPLVHLELQKIARAFLGREQQARSWEPTMLVNEAFLRLINCQQVGFQDRSHFFRLAAKKMREILVDYARRRRLHKMGGDVIIVPIKSDIPVQGPGHKPLDFIALDDALRALEALDQRKAQIVEMRFFAGLTIEEIAAALGLGASTVHSDLHIAKLMLFRFIQEGPAS